MQPSLDVCQTNLKNSDERVSCLCVVLRAIWEMAVGGGPPNAKVIEFELKLVSNTCGIMQRMFTILYYILLLSFSSLSRPSNRHPENLKLFSFLFILSTTFLRRATHTHATLVMIKLSSHMLRGRRECVFPILFA